MGRIHLTIDYCANCGLLQPALVMTRELLKQYEGAITVTICPVTEGHLALRVGERVLFSSLDAGRLPVPGEFVRLVGPLLS